MFNMKLKILSFWNLWQHVLNHQENYLDNWASSKQDDILLNWTIHEQILPTSLEVPIVVLYILCKHTKLKAFGD